MSPEEMKGKLSVPVLLVAEALLPTLLLEPEFGSRGPEDDPCIQDTFRADRVRPCAPAEADGGGKGERIATQNDHTTIQELSN